MSETGYLHGYSEPERERLHRQARFLEPAVHDRLPFRRRRRLIEVGVGVGAQTEILLRHFQELHVTGVEINDAQIAEARRFLATVPWATGRYDIAKSDATRLEFEPESFDSAFLCWILEGRTRSEQRFFLRVHPGARAGVVSRAGRSLGLARSARLATRGCVDGSGSPSTACTPRTRSRPAGRR